MFRSTYRRRKIEPADGINVITSIFDEIAVFATVLGTEQEQRQFVSLLRDLVARGRAAAMPVIAATQRPSVDIIPKSLRDLFGYRAAFRCTSNGSSDIILGDGWSSAGITATSISPQNPGEAFLIAEGGIPQRIKAAYLSDADIIALANHATWIRRTHPPTTTTTQARPSPSPDPRPRKEPPCHPPPTRHYRQAFITGLRNLADYLDRHPAVPLPGTAPRSSCPPTAPTTAAAPRSTTSHASSASPPKTTSPIPGTTEPSAPSARSATG